MVNDLITKEKAEELLQSIDKVLKSGRWEESNFLKMLGKNLFDIRQDLATQLKTLNPVSSEPQNLKSMALRNDQLEVFVGLYSSFGSTLASWERVLVNLPKQVISRPIYPNEEDVKDIIKTKENKVNEAYVSIFINKLDVIAIAAEKIPKDKLGKPLLTLKDKAINVDNIHFFIHETGKYSFRNGKLIKS